MVSARCVHARIDNERASDVRPRCRDVSISGHARCHAREILFLQVERSPACSRCRGEPMSACRMRNRLVLQRVSPECPACACCVLASIARTPKSESARTSKLRDALPSTQRHHAGKQERQPRRSVETKCCTVCSMAHSVSLHRRLCTEGLIQEVVDKHGLQAVFRLMAKPRIHKPSANRPESQAVASSPATSTLPRPAPAHQPFVMSLHVLSPTGSQTSSQSPNSDHKLSTASTPTVFALAEIQEKRLREHGAALGSQAEIAKLLELMQPISVKSVKKEVLAERQSACAKPASAPESDSERVSSPALSATTTTSHSSQSPADMLLMKGCTDAVSPPPFFDTPMGAEDDISKPICAHTHDKLDLAAVEALLTLSTRITSTSAPSKRPRAPRKNGTHMPNFDAELGVPATGVVLSPGSESFGSLAYPLEKARQKRRRQLQTRTQAADDSPPGVAGNDSALHANAATSNASPHPTCPPPPPLHQQSLAEGAQEPTGGYGTSSWAAVCLKRDQRSSRTEVAVAANADEGAAGSEMPDWGAATSQLTADAASFSPSAHAAAAAHLLLAAATAAVTGELCDDGDGWADFGAAGARGSYKCGRCGQPKKGHKCVEYARDEGFRRGPIAAAVAGSEDGALGSDATFRRELKPDASISRRDTDSHEPGETQSRNPTSKQAGSSGSWEGAPPSQGSATTSPLDNREGTCPRGAVGEGGGAEEVTCGGETGKSGRGVRGGGVAGRQPGGLNRGRVRGGRVSGGRRSRTEWDAERGGGLEDGAGLLLSADVSWHEPQPGHRQSQGARVTTQSKRGSLSATSPASPPPNTSGIAPPGAQGEPGDGAGRIKLEAAALSGGDPGMVPVPVHLPKVRKTGKRPGQAATCPGSRPAGRKAKGVGVGDASSGAPGTDRHRSPAHAHAIAVASASPSTSACASVAPPKSGSPAAAVASSSAAPRQKPPPAGSVASNQMALFLAGCSSASSRSRREEDSPWAAKLHVKHEGESPNSLPWLSSSDPGLDKVNRSYGEGIGDLEVAGAGTAGGS